MNFQCFKFINLDLIKNFKFQIKNWRGYLYSCIMNL